MRKTRTFRLIWWAANFLAALSVSSLIYSMGWEYSTRQYLRGFSNAVVPASATPEQKVEAILAWMRSGPARLPPGATGLSARDPEIILNHAGLLSVCGSATNAFLNLSRSVGLGTRRLLLVTPNYKTKHVMAEVPIAGRWVIVDPAYRVIFRDSEGRLLTRMQLRDPETFAQATSVIANYSQEYNQHFTHVRIERAELGGLPLRAMLDRIVPGWEEKLDWSLALERESFFVLLASTILAACFVLVRSVLAWYADHRLRASRFRLRFHILQARDAFSSTPEIK